MKTFMEEYGLIVVAAIVIMIFVVVATPIGEQLVQGVNTAISELTTELNKATSGLNFTPAGSYDAIKDGSVN